MRGGRAEEYALEHRIFATAILCRPRVESLDVSVCRGLHQAVYGRDSALDVQARCFEPAQVADAGADVGAEAVGRRRVKQPGARCQVSGADAGAVTGAHFLDCRWVVHVQLQGEVRGCSIQDSTYCFSAHCRYHRFTANCHYLLRLGTRQMRCGARRPLPVLGHDLVTWYRAIFHHPHVLAHNNVNSLLCPYPKTVLFSGSLYGVRSTLYSRAMLKCRFFSFPLLPKSFLPGLIFSDQSTVIRQSHASFRDVCSLIFAHKS